MQADWNKLQKEIVIFETETHTRIKIPNEVWSIKTDHHFSIDFYANDL